MSSFFQNVFAIRIPTFGEVYFSLTFDLFAPYSCFWIFQTLGAFVLVCFLVVQIL